MICCRFLANGAMRRGTYPKLGR